MVPEEEENRETGLVVPETRGASQPREVTPAPASVPEKPKKRRIPLPARGVHELGVVLLPPRDMGLGSTGPPELRTVHSDPFVGP